MKMGTVILICGLPGSGKTTLAKRLELERNAVRFCSDEWMEELGISLWDAKAREVLEQQFWRLSQAIALHGGTAILENGFWSRAERDGYLQTAHEQGFNIELCVLFVPKEETRKRLATRGMEGDALILSEKLDEYYRLFEIPTEEELAQYDRPQN